MQALVENDPSINRGATKSGVYKGEYYPLDKSGGYERRVSATAGRPLQHEQDTNAKSKVSG